VSHPVSPKWSVVKKMVKTKDTPLEATTPEK
jgi:hypothetical protein